jgi:hypothetical protein
MHFISTHKSSSAAVGGNKAVLWEYRIVSQGRIIGNGQWYSSKAEAQKKGKEHAERLGLK